jgi:hypothetical protein
VPACHAYGWMTGAWGRGGAAGWPPAAAVVLSGDRAVKLGVSATGCILYLSQPIGTLNRSL